MRVKKFTHSKVDLSIPALSVKTVRMTKDYVISLTPAQIVLNACKEQDLSEIFSLILTHDLLDRCSLREDIQRAAGLIR